MLVTGLQLMIADNNGNSYGLLSANYVLVLF